MTSTLEPRRRPDGDPVFTVGPVTAVVHMEVRRLPGLRRAQADRFQVVAVDVNGYRVERYESPVVDDPHRALVVASEHYVMLPPGMRTPDPADPATTFAPTR